MPRCQQLASPKRTTGRRALVEDVPANESQSDRGGPAETAYGPRPSRRNPFPGESFFMVPIALYESGLSRWMRPSQFIRYVTLLRVANYRSTVQITIDLRSLEELDGVSTRSARDAHTKLQEYGLIRIAKTHPFTYTLQSPEFWERNFGNMKPTFKRGHSLKVVSEWIDE